MRVPDSGPHWVADGGSEVLPLFPGQVAQINDTSQLSPSGCRAAFAVWRPQDGRVPTNLSRVVVVDVCTATSP